jgi:hypothetical protein
VVENAISDALHYKDHVDHTTLHLTVVIEQELSDVAAAAATPTPAVPDPDPPGDDLGNVLWNRRS